MMKTMYVNHGRERSILQRHPWVFSGAVRRVEGDPAPGETVVLRTMEGKWLALAAYSPASQIAARIWTWDSDEPVDEAFFRRRIEAALDLRRALVPAAETNAFRLIHGESDGLPGLVVDRYAGQLVVQFASAGVEFWRETIIAALVHLTGCEQIYERSDVDVRRLEGFEPRAGVLRGQALNGPLEIIENGLRFGVNVMAGQKTGFYLDQRRNRQRVRTLAEGKRWLNTFCYTGAFTIYALAGGASHVLSIDSSADALAAGRQNVLLNDLPLEQTEWLEADVFQALRELRDRGDTFDAIILDPPKFAQTAAQAQRAARGYKDINLLAFKLLRPGGLLFTFSCSGGVSSELFQKIVAGAALDAGVDARIVGHMEQGPDHPVALNFPEGAYLKGLICAV